MKEAYKKKELRKMREIDLRTRNLPITDDRSEMERVGRRIFEENPHIYSEKIVNDIRGYINEVMPGVSEEERDSFFFGSIYDYWVYGNSMREEFYYDFPNKTHREKQEYLTMRKRMLFFSLLNDDNDRDICADKWKFRTRFKEFFKRDAMLIDDGSDISVFKEFEKFTEKNPEFIIKPIDLGEGCGVEKMSLSDFGGDKHLMFEAVRKKRETILTDHSWGDSSAVMLEEILVSTDAMRVFHPQSTNFVRCPTILTNGKVNIYRPWFVCGNGGDFFIRGFGNYNFAGIDPQSGIVETKLSTERRVFRECHPDTNVRVTGSVIPKWDELISVVTRMALMLPTVRCIAWDMVLSDKYGWVPIEANDDGEPLWQLCYDKGCKAEMERLAELKLSDDKFWWEMV